MISAFPRRLPIASPPGDDRGSGFGSQIVQFAEPPVATSPTTCPPRSGCSRTPALTTDDWTLPSPRNVLITHKP